MAPPLGDPAQIDLPDRLGLDPHQAVRMDWLGVSPGKTPLERNLTLGLIEATVAHGDAVRHDGSS